MPHHARVSKSTVTRAERFAPAATVHVLTQFELPQRRHRDSAGAAAPYVQGSELTPR